MYDLSLSLGNCLKKNRKTRVGYFVYGNYINVIIRFQNSELESVQHSGVIDHHSTNSTGTGAVKNMYEMVIVTRRKID